LEISRAFFDFEWRVESERASIKERIQTKKKSFNKQRENKNIFIIYMTSLMHEKKGREMSAFTEEEEESEFIPSILPVVFSEDKNYPLKPRGIFPVTWNILRNGHKFQYSSGPHYHEDDVYYLKGFMNFSVQSGAKVHLRDDVVLVSVEKMREMLTLTDTTTQRKYERMVLEKFKAIDGGVSDRTKKIWAPKTNWFGEW